jgi:8-oxo-dGTP pyrophosphatase MutT (NUDIX family)
MVTPVPASTVLLLRDGSLGLEVFMVRRHQDLAFMAGAHVFPGGRVDEADYVDDVNYRADENWCDGFDHAARQLPGIEPRLALAYHVAAVREVFEEAGVLLARERSVRPGGIMSAARAQLAGCRQRVLTEAGSFRSIIEDEGLQLALDSLVVCAHWVTPARLSRRFDTLFFAARMPAGQTASHDNGETVEGLWVAPRHASEKDLLLPPPTRITLEEIRRFETVDALLAWYPGRPIERREPL